LLLVRTTSRRTSPLGAKARIICTFSSTRRKSANAGTKKPTTKMSTRTATRITPYARSKSVPLRAITRRPRFFCDGKLAELGPPNLRKQDCNHSISVQNSAWRQDGSSGTPAIQLLWLVLVHAKLHTRTPLAERRLGVYAAESPVSHVDDLTVALAHSGSTALTMLSCQLYHFICEWLTHEVHAKCSIPIYGMTSPAAVGRLSFKTFLCFARTKWTRSDTLS
jgi:hypothetical protein